MTMLAATYSGIDREIQDPVAYRGQFSGQLWRFSLPTAFLVSSTKNRIYLPPATAATGKRPCGSMYQNRAYMVGGHTANLVVDEDFRCFRQSLPAPNQAPSVAVGAGTTQQICYTRFFDEVTNEISPLSDGTTVTGNVTRVWTALPTEVPNEVVPVEGTTTFAAGALTGVKSNYGDLRPHDRIAVSTDLTRWAQIKTITSNLAMTIDDTGMVGAGVSLVARPFSRASHIELWVAVQGALPRRAVRVRIGTTSVTEATPALALGVAETLSFTAMPRGEFSIIYNDRQLVAGVDAHRDTLYLSAIGQPERYEGLAFRTGYGEPIVGMFRYHDYVVLLCPPRREHPGGSSYKLQGYTEDDYVRVVLDPDYGGLGHHGNMVVNGRAYVPGPKGLQLFNGAWHPAMPKRKSEWTRKYKAARVAFDEGFSVVNPDDQTYHFYPRADWLHPGEGDGPGSITPGPPVPTEPAAWIGHYDRVGPLAGGSIVSPAWTNDSMGTPDQAAGSPDNGFVTYAAYLTAAGERVGTLCHGSSKGRVYLNDRGSFVGTATWATYFHHHGDPGGDVHEGKLLLRVHDYLVKETGSGAALIRIWAGDEFCYPTDEDGDPAQPVFSADILASNLTVGDLTYAPTVCRTFKVERPGRGFVFEHVYVDPDHLEWIGLSGEIGPGVTSRNPLTDSGGGG